MNPIHIGIDAGGTLVKVAASVNGAIMYRKFPARKLGVAAEWLNRHYFDATLCMTGGKADMLQALFPPGRCSTLPEFAATCSGIQYLLKDKPDRPESFILTNVGTGTSIHYLDGQTQTRIGGTGVGGGTLIGLASLLTGLGDYEEIVEIACSGRRHPIDLKVQDIYEGSTPPIIGDLTASNFGKGPFDHVDAFRREDLLAAVIGLVGETVATASIFASGQFGTRDIVYIGSTFDGNPLLRDTVADYTRFKEANPLFVENGEYSGAIGAMLNCAQKETIK